MDRALYSVRPFAETDYEAEARIDHEIDPRLPFTAEEIRHWNQTLTAEPHHLNLKFAVEDRRSGELVAYGALHHTLFNYHPQKFWIYAFVDPAHQGQGIGSELYSLLESEAIAREAICLWSSVLDDHPRSVRFLKRQGFLQRRKTWLSRLDLVAANLSKFPDRSKALAGQGIRFTTIYAEGADRPEVRDRLYRLSLLASKDVPRLGDYAPVSFEEFVAIELEGPGVLPDAIFLACEGAAFVGMSTLERELARPDTLRVGFTGTHPEFRCRGIATELKRRAVEYARDHGFRFLVTANDSVNRGIWAINERLGFRPEITWIQAEKVLASAKT